MRSSPPASMESSPLNGTSKASQTIGYYTAFVALGLSAASLGPTLPGLAEHTQTHFSGISFLFVARSLGYLLGSLQAGHLYDRLRGHPVLAGTLLAMAAMLALVPLTPVLWLLTAALLVLGVAEGTLDVGGNTLLVWAHRHKLGLVMNGLHFCYGAGAFLSPIIIAQAVLVSGDITWAYWVLALLMLPVVLWLLRLPSPEYKPDADPGRAGKANQRLIILISLFFFFHMGAGVSFGGWLFTYTTTLNLASPTMAAYLTSAFWGSLTLGRLLTLPVVARFRPTSILLANLIGCVVSVGIIVLWPGSQEAIWLGSLGFGLSLAAVFPTSLCLAQGRMAITGRTTSWFLAGGSLGGMCLPWLIGQLFESVGPQSVMFTVIFAMLAALIVLSVLIVFEPAHSKA
ncbi:MAG: MFS transporter [Ardenticatenia bacterium]|nr:MFS transporter [Ardenticatenia bacterium]